MYCSDAELLQATKLCKARGAIEEALLATSLSRDPDMLLGKRRHFEPKIIMSAQIRTRAAVIRHPLTATTGTM